MVIRLRKNKGKTARVVWRISDAAPLGEYVHIDADTADTAVAAAVAHVDPKPAHGVEDPHELPERGWHHSSHELVHGMDMLEQPLDTLPDELFDQFLKKSR
jgi:hypothetical protein